MLVVLPKYEGSPFMDKRVRQALTLAVDRQKILDIVYGGKSAWITNDTHMANFNEDFLGKSVVRDVKKAKKLLAEAGHAKRHHPTDALLLNLLPGNRSRVPGDG